jgi:hypothetical protein
MRKVIAAWYIRFVAPWARTPLYAAIVTLAGLFAGLLGSLYADEIKAVFPFVIWHTQISRHAVIVFWGSALLATFLFFLAQRGSEAERQESESRLDHRSEELAKLVRTLPPSDFLFTFRRIFWDCSVALAGVLGTPDSELSATLVEEAIRVVLAGVAKLAQKFDGAPEDFRYAANIMLFKPSEDLTNQTIEEIRKVLKFSPPETDLRALRGVLVLEATLSTTNQSAVPLKPDTDLTPIALAVPRIDRDPLTDKWRVLPGAPMAFCKGSLELYTDTHTLGDWCRSEGDFLGSTSSEIDSYFKSVPATQRDRSFVSISLKPLKGEAIGVMNVHRDHVGLLEEKEPAQQFYPLVSPFIFMLIVMLDVLKNLGQ